MNNSFDIDDSDFSLGDNRDLSAELNRLRDQLREADDLMNGNPFRQMPNWAEQRIQEQIRESGYGGYHPPYFLRSGHGINPNLPTISEEPEARNLGGTHNDQESIRNGCDSQNLVNHSNSRGGENNAELQQTGAEELGRVPVLSPESTNASAHTAVGMGRDESLHTALGNELPNDEFGTTPESGLDGDFLEMMRQNKTPSRQKQRESSQNAYLLLDFEQNGGNTHNPSSEWIPNQTNARSANNGPELAWDYMSLGEPYFRSSPGFNFSDHSFSSVLSRLEALVETQGLLGSVVPNHNTNQEGRAQGAVARPLLPNKETNKHQNKGNKAMVDLTSNNQDEWGLNQLKQSQESISSNQSDGSSESIIGILTDGGGGNNPPIAPPRSSRTNRQTPASSLSVGDLLGGIDDGDPRLANYYGEHGSGSSQRVPPTRNLSIIDRIREEDRRARELERLIVESKLRRARLEEKIRDEQQREVAKAQEKQSGSTANTSYESEQRLLEERLRRAREEEKLREERRVALIRAQEEQREYEQELERQRLNAQGNNHRDLVNEHGSLFTQTLSDEELRRQLLGIEQVNPHRHDFDEVRNQLRSGNKGLPEEFRGEDPQAAAAIRRRKEYQANMNKILGLMKDLQIREQRAQAAEQQARQRAQERHVTFDEGARVWTYPPQTEYSSQRSAHQHSPTQIPPSGNRQHCEQIRQDYAEGHTRKPTPAPRRSLGRGSHQPPLNSESVPNASMLSYDAYGQNSNLYRPPPVYPVERIFQRPLPVVPESRVPIPDQYLSGPSSSSQMYDPYYDYNQPLGSLPFMPRHDAREDKTEKLYTAMISAQRVQIMNSIKDFFGNEGRAGVDAFFTRVDACTKDWSDEERIDLLRVKCRKNAKQQFEIVIDKYGDKVSYEFLKEEIISGLAATDNEEFGAFFDLQKYARRGYDEDIAKYGERLMRMVQNSEPDLNRKQRESIAKKYFVENINDVNIAMQLCNADRNKSYNELVCMASRMKIANLMVRANNSSRPWFQNQNQDQKGKDNSNQFSENDQDRSQSKQNKQNRDPENNEGYRRNRYYEVSNENLKTNMRSETSEPYPEVMMVSQTNGIEEKSEKTAIRHEARIPESPHTHFFNKLCEQANEHPARYPARPAPLKCVKLDILIEGAKGLALIDTGAESSVICPDFLHHIVQKTGVDLMDWGFCPNDGEQGASHRVSALGNNKVSLYGVVRVPMKVVEENKTVWIVCLIAKEKCPYNVILGTRALHQFGYYISNHHSGQNIELNPLSSTYISSFRIISSNSSPDEQHSRIKETVMEKAEIAKVVTDQQHLVGGSEFEKGKNENKSAKRKRRKKRLSQSEVSPVASGRQLQSEMKAQPVPNNANKQENLPIENKNQEKLRSPVIRGNEDQQLRKICKPHWIVRKKVVMIVDEYGKDFAERMDAAIIEVKGMVGLGKLVDRVRFTENVRSIVIMLGGGAIEEGLDSEAAKLHYTTFLNYLIEFGQAKVLLVPPFYNHAKKSETFQFWSMMRDLGLDFSFRTNNRMKTTFDDNCLGEMSEHRSFCELFRYSDKNRSKMVNQSGRILKDGVRETMIWLNTVFNAELGRKEDVSLSGPFSGMRGGQCHSVNRELNKRQGHFPNRDSKNEQSATNWRSQENSNSSLKANRSYDTRGGTYHSGQKDEKRDGNSLPMQGYGLRGGQSHSKRISGIGDTQNPPKYREWRRRR